MFLRQTTDIGAKKNKTVLEPGWAMVEEVNLTWERGNIMSLK